jgi:hypothetical protein
MNESTSSFATGGSESKRAVESIAKEISQRPVREAILSPIVPVCQHPCGNSSCPLDFELPFQKTGKAILRNGSAALLTADIMKADRSLGLWRFMNYNFPIVNEIYVKFTAGTSWCGDAVSHQ